MNIELKLNIEKRLRSLHLYMVIMIWLSIKHLLKKIIVTSLFAN